MVSAFGASAALNAYTSVSSAVGSTDDSGASRWLEPELSVTASAPAPMAASNAARRAGSFRTMPGQLLRMRSVDAESLRANPSGGSLKVPANSQILQEG